jgi:hypothetical protein
VAPQGGWLHLKCHQPLRPRDSPDAPPSAPLPGSSSALLPLRCTLDHRRRAVAYPSSWRFGTARSHAPTGALNPAVMTGCWSCKLQQGKPSTGSCRLVAPNPCHRFSKSMPWNFELFRRMLVHTVSWRAAKFKENVTYFSGARSWGVIVAVLGQLLAGVGLGGRCCRCAVPWRFDVPLVHPGGA